MDEFGESEAGAHSTRNICTHNSTMEVDRTNQAISQVEELLVDLKLIGHDVASKARFSKITQFLRKTFIPEEAKTKEVSTQTDGDLQEYHNAS